MSTFRSEAFALKAAAVVLLLLVGATRERSGAQDPPPTVPDSPASAEEEAAAEAAGERSLQEPRAVIPRGQEELIGAMLGGEAKLAGCVLGEGQVDRQKVRASYKCAAGDVVVELRHPGEAPAGSVKTEHFAIVVESGAPPPELIAELANRIREREAGFEWKWVGGASPERRLLQTILLVSAGVLGFAALAWVLQRRLAGGRRARR